MVVVVTVGGGWVWGLSHNLQTNILFKITATFEDI